MKRGHGNVVMQEVPVPKIRLTEVLKKVWAAGVCGSDLNIHDDTYFYDVPVSIGHEYFCIAGEVGSDVCFTILLFLSTLQALGIMFPVSHFCISALLIWHVQRKRFV